MAPKPLDAPVITTVFRSVVVSSDMLVSFTKRRLYGDERVDGGRQITPPFA
jgi:hypothetical protein